jgi:chemotaxis signal transduction protein
MLLIMCHSNGIRYAFDPRNVCEVLPRVNLHRLGGSPSWFAGMLICRGSVTPVIDFGQLTEGTPCPGRLSSRIVVLQVETRGSSRHFGVLVESVGLREIPGQLEGAGGEVGEASAFGMLHLDEQGVFQLVDIPRLISEDRQAFLFPAREKGL